MSENKIKVTPKFIEMAGRLVHGGDLTHEQYFMFGPTRQDMYDAGLIDDKSNATDKLRAWVDHLCKQPFPEAVYKVPEAGVQSS